MFPPSSGQLGLGWATCWRLPRVAWRPLACCNGAFSDWILLLLLLTRLDKHALCMSTPRDDAMQLSLETNWTSGETPGSHTPVVPSTPSPRWRRTVGHRGLQKKFCVAHAEKIHNPKWSLKTEAFQRSFSPQMRSKTLYCTLASQSKATHTTNLLSWDLCA